MSTHTENAKEMVLYKSLDSYYCTTVSNRNAMIQNARMIYNLHTSNRDDAIEIMNHNFGKDWREERNEKTF